MSIDLPAALSVLAEQRPVFHSEADFQFALAWVIRERHPGIEVRLERPVILDGRRGHVDIWLRDADGEKAIELKYWTGRNDLFARGERFDLREWAGDIERCGFWKDVDRVERLLDGGVCDDGYVIALSNVRGSWGPPTQNWERTNDAAFRVHGGRAVTGVLDWRPNTAPGTRGMCVAPIEVSGRYRTAWRDYSKPVPGTAGGEFRYLLLDVGAALDAS